MSGATTIVAPVISHLKSNQRVRAGSVCICGNLTAHTAVAIHAVAISSSEITYSSVGAEGILYDLHRITSKDVQSQQHRPNVWHSPLRLLEVTSVKVQITPAKSILDMSHMKSVAAGLPS